MIQKYLPFLPEHWSQLECWAALIGGTIAVILLMLLTNVWWPPQ